MNWIEITAPLVGVILGWGLSERAKIWSDKRLDKRKLKRLLFFVLELRFHFSRELNAQKEIDDYAKKALQKLNIEHSNEIELGVEMYKPMITEVLKRNFGADNKIKFLEENIDDVIIDLSEIFPVFAYELSGQHNIKERLKLAENYLGEFDELFNQMPFNIKEWFKPKLTKDLLREFDNNLKKIAIKINRETWTEVQAKIDKMDTIENIETDKILVDLIEKIKDKI